jgi:hypothetical protein
MPIDISVKVQAQRDSLLKESSDATIKLAELQRAYNESPEHKLERDREYLQKLQADPFHLNRVLGGNTAAANEEAMLAARIRDAEVRAERERLALPATAPTADPAAGEVTYGSQIPARDLADAAGELVAHGTRPTFVENVLATGRSGGPDDRATEIALAREWERRLLADPELQRKFFAKDPEIMEQFSYYAGYAPAPHER